MIECTCIGQHLNRRFDFSSCESAVLVSQCVFYGLSEIGEGGAICLSKATIEFSLIDSTLTNCTSRSHGGGVYCQSKNQVLSRLCFSSCVCTSGTGNSAYLLLVDQFSTENREIVWSSFVSCPEKLNNQDMLETMYGIDHTEDTNISACEVVNFIYDIYNYKGFFFERCTYSNDMCNYLIWFPDKTPSKYLKQCNVCNNTHTSSGTMIINSSPTICEGCVFIQNTFNSLCYNVGMLETINCKFYANSFSQGNYATSLSLSHLKIAKCLNGGGSWKFSFRTHEAFSLWKVFKLSILVRVLGL